LNIRQILPFFSFEGEWFVEVEGYVKVSEDDLPKGKNYFAGVSGSAGAAGAAGLVGAEAGASGTTALFFGVILSTTEALFCAV